MMQIYEELKDYYTNDFGQKTLIVGTEIESTQIKDLLFNLGASIVSDRDVVILDHLLTRQLIQNNGFRVIDDFLYPYIGKIEESGTVLNNIKWVKNFPDPFIEKEIYEVLIEYFSENEESDENAERLKQIFNFIRSTFNEKVIPRSLVRLSLNNLLDSDQYIFLDSLLQNLPVRFQEDFVGKVLKSNRKRFCWSKQIELYKELEADNISLEFLNFRSQLEEVRFVLEKMKTCSDLSENLFLYPRNQGYEGLFFLYQREFFKDQVFFYTKREKSFLENCILKLKSRIETVETNYNRNFESKQTIKLKKREEAFLSYVEVLKIFEGKFTEYDLNLLSPVTNQIDHNLKISIPQWIDILSEIESKEKRKFKKITTKLPIKEYSYFPLEETKNLYILGWGDLLFKRNGEKIFSASVLSKLERDLGLDLVSLNQSSVKELMKNSLIYDSGTKTHILHSEKTAVGSSVRAGVFKILSDKNKDADCVEREFTENKLNKERNKIEYTDNKISASSLQRYDECPYKFYLEKVLCFNFEDEKDYFLSPKEEGLLIHKALEELNNRILNKEGFSEIIKKMIHVKDENLNHFRSFTVDRFTEHLWCIIESERKHIEDTGIVEVELEKFFSFFANRSAREFVQEKGEYKIVGVVDRIDISAQKEAFLYDYKRAGTGSVSLSRYTGSKLAPQLFLYCIAADKGFLGDFKDFLGFQYINVKTYTRSKGFVDKERGKDFAKELPQGSAVTTEKYQEKLNLFLDKFWNVLNRIANNDFNEKPNSSYSETCSNCNWVGVCKKAETFQ